MSINENPHALAVITRLETVTLDGTALRVGDAVAPKSSTGAVVAPCAVLYGRQSGILTSSIGEVDTDGVIRFQVTAVGRTAAEARVVADKTRAALTAPDLTVAGRWVEVRSDSASSTVNRDDDIRPPLFYATTLYRLLTFSAA